MTIEQYTTRPSWTQQSNQELKTALTPYEVKLAERHIIVNIIGKRGRIVPVLLTPEIKEGIDILINYRNTVVEINPKNPYIFSRSMMALTHLRGPDVLRKIVGEVEELEKPILITSTKLRKYVATVCQLFDLSGNENDWLARHLGHDIRVHREFYRLHEDVVELTKISRLLMAVDTGEANKFAGKQLKDITLEELPPIDEDDEEEEEEPQVADIENDFRTSLWAENSSLENDIGKEIALSSKKGKKRNNKNPWDADEKKAVFEYFRVQIKNGSLPGKADCEACQKKHPKLNNRKWTDIKFCVKNQMTRIKNIKKTK